MLTIERSLNIYAAGIPQIISLSQYDDDFQLVFTLYTSEGEFTIPSGTTAEVMGTKVDGNGYSANASISGSTVTVTGNKQMTACAGRNVYEIVLTKSGKRLATVNFILKVERAALDADTIQSETVLKELNAIIDSAATATEAATQAAASAAAAAESARTLTIDPTLTQSGQAADAKVTGDRIGAISEGGTEIITVDKSTFSKLDAYINQGAANLTSDTKCKTAYFACEPNITYTVHKVASARFRVGYTKTTPAHAVSVYGIQANNDATELTVETGSDAAYLVAYYYDSGNDTLSESVIYDSLQVTYEGESSEVTAVDKVARVDIVDLKEKVDDFEGISDEVKVALLNCFEHVTWIDAHGQDYYNALYNALYDTPIIEPIYKWDFTKSLVDSVAKLTAVTNATQNSNGITFDSANEYVDLGAIYSRNRTYEIDIVYIGQEVNSDYRRLFAFGENGTVTQFDTTALICSAYSAHAGWWWYKGSAWDTSAIDPSVAYADSYKYFDGKTMKIYIDSNGFGYVYAKPISSPDSAYIKVGESHTALNDYTSNARVYLGGSSHDSIANARISGFRVYEGAK